MFRNFFILLLTTLFITGCSYWPTIRAEQFDQNVILEPITSTEESLVNKEEFQYTAPWDKDVYDDFYAKIKDVPDIGDVKGGIVPHHLLAGYIPATFFKNLEQQKPSVIVLLGPNHFNGGGAKAISTLRDWQTPYGKVQTDKELVGKLAEKGLIKIHEQTIKEEHSIYSIVPFVAKSLPGTKILPIVFAYKTDVGKLNEILATLLPILPDDAVIVSSIDFSHYQTVAASNFHDELSKIAIENFDYGRLDKLEIDSAPSLYMLLRIMEYQRAQKIGFALSDNSAHILNNLSLKEGTSYFSPYFIEGEKNKTRVASILSFGDVMLDRDVRPYITASSSEYLLGKLAGQENRFFLGMDLIQANLEGPFANYRRQTSKSIAFQFDPKAISFLKKYDFSLFNLANNHSLDMGKDGFTESKENLKKEGIDYYGSQYEIDESSLLVKHVGDYNVGFIGINDTNGPVDMLKVKKLIASARRKASYVVINVHWGQEYKEISNTRQRKLAHDLIDAGVDVIIGHHPHVIQEMEIYKNRPIFYSLGNFIFDQYFSIPTQQSLSVGLILRDKEISAYVFPLQSVRSQVSQMSYSRSLQFFKDWKTASRLGNYNFNNFNINTNF